MTSGQVASIVRRLRDAEFSWTAGDDAVGGEDDDRALRHLGLLLDEDRPARGQLLDHVLVVDDLLADVDGGAVELQRALDRLHGAVDAGAVAAGGGEEDLASGPAIAVLGHVPKGTVSLSGDEHAGTTPRPADAPSTPPFSPTRTARRTCTSARSSSSRGRRRATPTWSSTFAGAWRLVPRFRQKLVVPPLEAGRPLWADDVNFNLSYHIRHTALPEPGGEAQLKRLAGRVFSQQLDRSKPLWELWLVQGLERDRFALLTKTHHAMVDGVSGVDIGTVLFDLEPVPAPAAVEDPWVPQPEPGTTELVARGISEAAGRRSSSPSGRSRRCAIRRRRRARRSRRWRAVSEVLSAFADPAPDVPLNQRSARTVATSGRARSWRPSNASRTASAAPSTTSSSPR